MENKQSTGGNGRDFTRNHSDREHHIDPDQRRPLLESRSGGNEGEKGNTETGAAYGHLRTNENLANEDYGAAPDRQNEQENQSRH